MANAPYGIRLLVGAAATAIEETLKLPQTVMTYPMTVASTVAQVVMKFQQDLADLAIKGDEALGTIFPPRDENPDWATFDDDLPADGAEQAETNGGRRTEGRFALYSVTDVDDEPVAARPVKKAAKKAPAKKTAKATKPATKTEPNPTAPPIVTELDYEALTLAQLRARMTSLSVADLRTLLSFEEAGRARAPFLTLLANRITRATAK
jgi:hypothetical protein